MAKRLKTHWPTLVAIVLLLATIGGLVWSTVLRNEGLLVYPIDDPYIHMALARNLAEHGVWGLNSDGFASCSSSLAWTLLLGASFTIAGVSEVVPLVLNALAGIGLLVLVGRVLAQRGFGAGARLVVLAGIVVFGPLVPVLFCGLEHVLHALLTLWFVHIAAQLLGEDRNTRANRIALLALAPLLVMTRYEGLFVLFAAGIGFLLRKRIRFPMLVGAVGVLPIVIFGCIALSKGWYFLPNSVLLKGNVPTLGSSRSALKLLYEFAKPQNVCLLLLLVMTVLLVWGQIRRQQKVFSYSTVVQMFFALTTVLHVQFAQTGWLFRYECYLIVLGLVAVALGLKDLAGPRIGRAWKIGVALATVVTAFLLMQRGLVALDRTAAASHNIYEQQYQMGRFLARFYPEATVAANDVGAINFLSEIRCVDLYGLGSMEVARARRAGEYDPAAMDGIARQAGATIAMVHQSWFDGYGGVPVSWVLCGRWRIPDNYICHEDTVTFYALTTETARALRFDLRAFSAELPENIDESGPYTENRDSE